MFDTPGLNPNVRVKILAQILMWLTWNTFLLRNLEGLPLKSRNTCVKVLIRSGLKRPHIYRLDGMWNILKTSNKSSFQDCYLYSTTENDNKWSGIKPGTAKEEDDFRRENKTWTVTDTAVVKNHETNVNKVVSLMEVIFPHHSPFNLPLPWKCFLFIVLTTTLSLFSLLTTRR